jgi:hypothetical protein
MVIRKSASITVRAIATTLLSFSLTKRFTAGFRTTAKKTEKIIGIRIPWAI